MLQAQGEQGERQAQNQMRKTAELSRTCPRGLIKFKPGPTQRQRAGVRGAVFVDPGPSLQ